MAERCPNCGNAAPDENSLFCNACGSRLPERLSNVVMSPARRTAVVPAPPRRVQGMPEAHQGGYDPAESAVKRFLRFDMLVTKKLVPVIYVLGAVALTLLALLSLLGGSSPDTGTAKTAGTAASSSDTTSFVFWTLVLVVGNIVWRLACEAASATFRIHDTPEPSAEPTDLSDPVDTGYIPDMTAQEPARQVRCSHCSSAVYPDQLRECEYCGVTGCERCIKGMGLIKKHLTCRDCYESHR